MKKTNSIIVLICLATGLLLIGSRIDRCTREDGNASIDILLSSMQESISKAHLEIAALETHVDSLNQQLKISQDVADSLRKVKNKIHIYYEAQILALSNEPILRQYDILLSYLNALELRIQPDKWQILQSDTFLLMNKPDLVSINTAGLLHQQCSETLEYTESIVNELDFQLGLLTEVNTAKDTIIQWKDTIIAEQHRIIEPLMRDNSRLQRHNKILSYAVGIASGLVIIQSIRR